MAKKDTTAAPKSIMEMVMADSQKRFKGDVYTAAEQINRMVGLEHYSLVFQWLIHSSVLPLQSVITYAAPPKTFKTSAALELLRLFLVSGGGGLYINTEGKLSPTKVRSILRELIDKLFITSAGTTNEWVETASNQLTTIHDAMSMIFQANQTTSKAAGLDEYKGRFFPPFAIVIDSLSGSQSESMAGRVQAGEVGKTFNDRAMIITQFLNTWSSLIVGLPVTLILINHEKSDMEGGRVTPGGVAPAFHTSLDIRCTRGKEIKVVRDGIPYTRTELSWYVNFSSIGKDHRRVPVDYIDTYDAEGNQTCWFDWDSALVTLLMSFSNDDVMRKEYAGVSDVVTIEEHQCGSKGLHYTCPQLGIKTKQDAMDNGVNKAKLGSMLQTNPEIRFALQKAMRIQFFTRWSPEYVFSRPNELPDVYKPKPKFGGK